jgi:cholesterol oxidase
MRHGSMLGRGHRPMSDTFDAIVIGSGFGGSITACRLAQRGMKVLVLERGRRWTPADYPRRPGDAWSYSFKFPEKRNGWLDLRVFKNMIVAQAAGVGGGSLTYSSVALEAHPSCFERGWPAEITYAELKPHYDTVAEVMNLQALPDNQLTARFKLAREAAEKLGHRDRFAKAPLAVSFSPDWHYDLENPFDRRHSKTFTNAQGQQQGTCIHLGNCDIGCDVQAKNGLDLTYIALAEQHGCEVRPLHLVRLIAPRGSGYRVVFDRIVQKRLVRGEAHAARVVVAAGSLGSTELLLRARDEYATLPKMSRQVGHGWSPNANVLSAASYMGDDRVQQSVGPTITSAIDFMDGSVMPERFVIEDDGFPNLLLNAMQASGDDHVDGDLGAKLLERLTETARENVPGRNLMLWLGAGVDAGDGELRLERTWLPPFRRALQLRWNADRSEAVIERILDLHTRLTEATGGKDGFDVAWRAFRSLLTLHPLGGCRMGVNTDTGVVNHLGEVFGYPNLYVVDGSIVPTAIGRNPSHTIAALAERSAALIP